jgi:hypothetical protein
LACSALSLRSVALMSMPDPTSTAPKYHRNR